MPLSRSIRFGAAACVIASTFACDRLPDDARAPASATPTGTTSAAAGTSITEVEALALDWFTASTTYAGRCIVNDDFSSASADLCTRIEHCDPGARMNMDAPCGFTEAERAAVVDAAPKLTSSLDALDTRAHGKLATFLRHAVLFSRWVSETTEIGGCEDRSPYGVLYCYERTRGTLAMYQEMARARFAWRPDPDGFVVPEAHHATWSAPPFLLYPAEVRKRGLPWGRCPDGMCIVVDKMQQTSWY